MWLIVNQNRHPYLSSYKKSDQTLNKQAEILVPKQPLKLLPFGSNHDVNTIPFTLYDDLELADYSGRLLHPKNAVPFRNKHLRYWLL